MVKIVRKKVLNPSVTLLEVEAPLIAKKARAGQFIILRLDEQGERIPLTIADYDREKGTVTIIFQKVGLTTELLADLNEGDSIKDFVGPLGLPTELPEGARRVCEGLEMDVIAGFRSKDIVILEDEFKSVSDHCYIMTDDGSYGEQGFVTVKLKELIDSGVKYDAVIAIGPIPMMKFVSKTTEPYGIKTIVSLNPIMIDGTGMCGGCRVTVGGKMKFACVDGPDFDGHEVDFDELMNRNAVYRAQEAEEKERHACRLDQLAHEMMDH